MCVPNAFPVILTSLDKGEQLIDNLRLTLEGDIVETMCVSHTVTSDGQSYRTWTAAKTDEPVFGEMVHLLPQVGEDTVLAFIWVLKVSCSDDHFSAYVVERGDEFRLCQL